MIVLNNAQTLKAFSVMALVLAVSGCSDGGSSGAGMMMPDDPMNGMEMPASKTFELTLINATANQPFAPAGVLAFETDQKAWTLGSVASEGLERLAEAGDSASWIAEHTSALATTMGMGILAPGAQEQVSMMLSADAVYLSVAAMPVNTNDAFAGVTGLDVTSLNVGDEMTLSLALWDAGTEANSELPETIPGPAGAGDNRGYLEQRDDVNYVAYHPGVVTAQDGLPSSTLDASHKFDQGGLVLRIMRSQ